MAIDIHTHIVPFDFPARPATKRWPQMQPSNDCGHRNVTIDGKVFRTVTDGSWDVGRRIQEMDRTGITMQVLSPMPELLSYWFSPTDALAIGRVVNETISTMVRQAPDRFAGLGMVPMQDPDLAARQVETLMNNGFAGIEIGTNVNGVSIGDASFAPVFAAAEATGAAVFVHALHPTMDNHLLGPPALRAVVAFPCETALAIAGLMTSGMLTRFPKLKIAFSHGGGAFGMVLPRLAHGWRTMAPVSKIMTESPTTIARRLYYDSLVYDAPTLAFLTRVFGETQIMVGTDYPFDIYERDPLGVLAAAGLADAAADLLKTGNARRFLGMA